MKFQNIVKSAIAALVLGSASQAMATAITVQAAGVPSYLNNNTYQGSFNLAGLPTGAYTINSISFSFAFADDTDPFTSVKGATTSTSTNTAMTSLPTGDKRYTTITTSTTDYTSTGQQESVQLSFGSVLFNGQTSASAPVVSTGATVTGQETLLGTSLTKANGDPCTQQNSSCKMTYHYGRTDTIARTTTTDYTGNIALGGSLLSYDSLIAGLMAQKVLNFDLGVSGDLNFTSASLNIDYTVTPTPPANVPEPGSLALFGIALLGAAGVRRARRG